MVVDAADGRRTRKNGEDEAEMWDRDGRKGGEIAGEVGLCVDFGENRGAAEWGAGTCRRCAICENALNICVFIA